MNGNTGTQGNADEPLRVIGTSAGAARLREDINVAARTDAKVLITGETGAGKDLAARLIHQLSRRAPRPYVAVNCAGLTDSLIESELFGHTRGSFTGAYRDRKGLAMAAHRGTLFLDEIEEMSPRMQALLLRFAESGEVHRVGSSRVDGIADARVIAASNRDLTERVAEGTFRGDTVLSTERHPVAGTGATRARRRRRPPPAPLSGTGDGVAGPSSARSHACRSRGAVRVSLAWQRP